MTFNTLVDGAYLNNLLGNVAGAIREKTGNENLINVDDFADEIRNITTDGILKTVAESTFYVPETQTGGSQLYKIADDIVNAVYQDFISTTKPYCYIYTITPIDVQLTPTAYCGSCEQFIITSAIRNQINIQYASNYHKFFTNDGSQFEKENGGVIFGSSFTSTSQSINSLTASVAARPYLSSAPLIQGTYKIAIHRLVLFE